MNPLGLGKGLRIKRENRFDVNILVVLNEMIKKLDFGIKI